MEKLSWKDVFDCKVWYGHISNIATAAHAAGYENFVWNGRVYKLVNTEWKDLGIAEVVCV